MSRLGFYSKGRELDVDITKAIQFVGLVIILAAAPCPLRAQQAQPAPPTTGAVDISTDAVIGTVEFLGSHRVPQDTLRALISSRQGDRYNADAIRRDAAVLMATGRYDDIRVEREVRPDGLVLRFVVAERKIERTPERSAAEGKTDIAEILEKFKQRNR